MFEPARVDDDGAVEDDEDEPPESEPDMLG